MTSLRIQIAGLAALLLTTSVALGLGADHVGPVGCSAWPKGLSELANRKDRVHGYFVNFTDVFFYSGDTEALNDFLAAYGKLQGTTLEVVIHPGPMKARSPWDQKDRDLSVDWQLTTSSLGPSSRGNGIEAKSTTRVDVWVGGKVKLDQLKVPENVKVRSGGEIEKFVERHAKESKAK